MKDNNGKEMGRKWAPNQRDPADLYKVEVLPEKPTVEVTKEGDRVIVKKVEKEE